MRDGTESSAAREHMAAARKAIDAIGEVKLTPVGLGRAYSRMRAALWELLAWADEIEREREESRERPPEPAPLPPPSQPVPADTPEAETPETPPPAAPTLKAPRRPRARKAKE
jgi:hypothetical protein